MTAPTPNVSRWLDRLEAAHKAATPGPWQYDSDAPDCVWDGDLNYPAILARVDEGSDAAAIVAAHNALPTLLATIRAVLQLADEWERDGWVSKAPQLRAVVAAAEEAKA